MKHKVVWRGRFPSHPKTVLGSYVSLCCEYFLDKYNTVYKHFSVAAPKGMPGTRAPSRSKSFIFIQFSEKILQNRRLTHPRTCLTGEGGGAPYVNRITDRCKNITGDEEIRINSRNMSVSGRWPWITVAEKGGFTAGPPVYGHPIVQPLLSHGHIFTTRKVMFSEASVIVFTGWGESLSRGVSV